MDTVDVAICGGGPVGAALALALTAAGSSCMVLDSRPAASDPDFGAGPDPRTVALSYGSRLVLERLGVWSALDATPIVSILVSQQGGFGRTVLNAADEKVPALGYVIALAELNRVLRAACEARVGIEHGARVTAVAGASNAAAVTYMQRRPDGNTEQRNLTARLLAIADGGEGMANGDAGRVERDYGQTAIVADVTPRQPHGNRAWERFARNGPIALLPKGSGYALVWSMLPATADALLQAPDTEFLAQLAVAMGWPAESFAATGPRMRFALGLRYRRQITGERTLMLGNAAQTLHPVAGQGLNLGLRDAWELSQALTGVADCGSAAALAAYAAGRRVDRYGAIGFTDVLARIFTLDSTALRVGRGAALTLLDLLPPMRHFLARRMIFGASAWP
jgi:2-octaprenyl-6-methoxyphenol hydroxylase